MKGEYTGKYLLYVVDVGLYLGLTSDLNCVGGGGGVSGLIRSVLDRACRRTGLLNFCKENK